MTHVKKICWKCPNYHKCFLAKRFIQIWIYQNQKLLKIANIFSGYLLPSTFKIRKAFFISSTAKKLALSAFFSKIISIINKNFCHKFFRWIIIFPNILWYKMQPSNIYQKRYLAKISFQIYICILYSLYSKLLENCKYFL